MGSRGNIKIFACPSGVSFSESVIDALNDSRIVPQSSKNLLSPLTRQLFGDGELKIIIEETVRGCDVYLVQNCFDPTTEYSIHENFLEMLTTVDALKRAGAKKVTIVLPYLPYSRQDKTKRREPITASLIAKLIEVAGVDNVLTTDIHADQIEGFYRGTKLDNLRGSKVLMQHIKSLYKENELENLVIMAPDAGGAPRAHYYAKQLGCDAAQVFKQRSHVKSNVVEEMKVLGDVEGKDIIIVDDMIDSGGSVCKLIELLLEKKAKQILIVCTHTLFNKDAIPCLSELGDKHKVKVISTDTIPRDQKFLDEHKEWYTQVSIAPVFAKAVYALNNDISLEDVYKED